MFPQTSQRGNDFAAAMVHRTVDFGTDSLRMLSHVGFGVSSPFLYSYHAITQKGSLEMKMKILPLYLGNTEKAESFSLVCIQRLIQKVYSVIYIFKKKKKIILK
ncbi:MAG: hypothetical protein K1000chlam1_01476 [Candidatus Anoxychlamydiales bacterium]|nr:hypothetical protein [Candidatus Anoxychlamydiales bacterium]